MQTCTLPGLFFQHYWRSLCISMKTCLRHGILLFIRYQERCRKLEEQLQSMSAKAANYREELKTVRKLNIGLQTDLLDFLKKQTGKLIWPWVVNGAHKVRQSCLFYFILNLFWTWIWFIRENCDPNPSRNSEILRGYLVALVPSSHFPCLAS